MDLIHYFDSFLRYFLVFAVDGDGRDAGMFLCNLLLYLLVIFLFECVSSLLLFFPCNLITLFLLLAHLFCVCYYCFFLPSF